jgi:hypothetical protein
MVCDGGGGRCLRKEYIVDENGGPPQHLLFPFTKSLSVNSKYLCAGSCMLSPKMSRSIVQSFEASMFALVAEVTPSH